MMSPDLLFDTNAFIAASTEPLSLLGAIPPARTLNITFVSVGELLFGALNSDRAAMNLASYQERLEDYIIIQPTGKTPMFYAQTRLQLKRRGVNIPANDVWIAALALENNLPLVTRDAHFERVEGLRVVGF